MCAFLLLESTFLSVLFTFLTDVLTFEQVLIDFPFLRIWLLLHTSLSASFCC